MKKLAVVFLGMLILGSALAGCGSGSNTISASLGDKFALKVGQSADISAESLKVTFDKVLNDSRCPDGATCIWAGQVQCLVTLDLNGKKAQITLTQLGSTDPTSQEYDRYKIAFNVTPYPKLNQTISTSDYRLNMTITKKP
ncbi:MAG: hypothetical protein TUN42_10760 [Dehalogenimonas sp.]